MSSDFIRTQKKNLRRRILTLLRQKATLSPDEVAKSSHVLCLKLLEYIEKNHIDQLKNENDETTLASTVYVLSYIPLFYEVDLTYLINELWWKYPRYKSRIPTHDSASHTSENNIATNQPCLIPSVKHVSCESRCRDNDEKNAQKLDLCIMLPLVLDSPEMLSYFNSDNTALQLMTSDTAPFIRCSATDNVDTVTKIKNCNCSCDVHGKTVTIQEDERNIRHSINHGYEQSDSQTYVADEYMRYLRQNLKQAMLFIEVLGSDDLQKSWETRGKYQLHELKLSILPEIFTPTHNQRRESAIIHRIDDAEFKGHAHRHTSHDTETRNNNSFDKNETDDDKMIPVRRIIACDEWENLFPQYLRPPGLQKLKPTIHGELIKKSQTASETDTEKVSYATKTRTKAQQTNAYLQNITKSLHTEVKMSQSEKKPVYTQQTKTTNICPYAKNKISQVLIFCPGVAYDVSEGIRLGKGGGYYDRFLQHLNAQRTAPQQTTSTDIIIQSQTSPSNNERQNDNNNHARNSDRPHDEYTENIWYDETSLKVIGVAFDMQIHTEKHGDKIQAMPHSEPNTIDTPTHTEIGQNEKREKYYIPHDPQKDANVMAVATPTLGLQLVSKKRLQNKNKK